MPLLFSAWLRTAVSTSTARLRPGGDRNGDHRHRHVEDLAVADVAGESRHRVCVGFLAFAQRLEVDHQAQVFGRLYGHVAKHLAHVEHAQAAHFQQVLQQLGAGAVDHVRRDQGELGGVVGDQPMAAA